MMGGTVKWYRYFYAKNEVLVMETKRQQEKSPKIKPVKEQLTEREWKEIRGENRQILRRKHGGSWSK
jgi:hypothetical protein